MKKLKYVIVSPFSCESGGSLVLRSLCKYLCELGEDSKIYYSSLNDEEKILKKIRFFIVRLVKYNLAKISKKIRNKYKIIKPLNCRQKITNILHTFLLPHSFLFV